MKTLIIFFLFAFSIKAQNYKDYLQKAQQGNVNAMLKLHEYYLIIKDQPDSAAYWIKKAAQKKDPTALYFVGLGYFKGLDGFPKNINKGLNLLKEAADSGNALAMIRLMEIYGDTAKSSFIDYKYKKLRNKKKAFFYALKAAQKYKIEAMHYVANAYLTGNGTPRNDSLALFWFHELAERFHYPSAQLKLANIYYYAETKYGRNLEKAYFFYEKLANNPKASIEQKAEGRIGMFQIKQLPEWIHFLKINAFLQIFPKELFWEIRW